MSENIDIEKNQDTLNVENQEKTLDTTLDTNTNNVLNFWNTGKGILISILIPFAIIAPLVLLIIAFTNDPVLGNLLVWVTNILILIIIYLVLGLDNENYKSLGISFNKSAFTFEKLGKTLLKTIIITIGAVASFLIGTLIGGIIFGVPEANLDNYNPLKGNLLLLLIFLPLVWVGSSFGEEIVYRGFLITRIEKLCLKRFSNKVSINIAVFMSGVIFGLAHFTWGPIGMIQTAFFGWFLSLSYINKRINRNLWPLVITHAIMDTILFVQQYLG